MSKKVLSLVLALVMVLGTFGTAFADTTETTVAPAVNEKIEKLKEMGLIQGYEDGTLGLENQITRAEMATMIVRSLGLESAAVASAAFPSQFSDMNGANVLWARGYVNVAVGQGVVKGYPEGTFLPANNVTYAEAIAMLVRAGNHITAAEEAVAVWPATYLTKAAQIGLLNGIEGIVDYNAPALRGKLFELVYNAAEIGGNLFVASTLQGIVVENYRTESLDKDEIVVHAMKDQVARSATDKEANTKYYEENDEFEVVLTEELAKKGSDVESLLGKVVEISFDRNNKIVDIKVLAGYEYITGAVDSITDKKIEVNEKTYTVSKSEARDTADERLYQAYLNNNDVEYDELYTRSKANAEYANITVRNGKVLFIDAFKFDDVAPVANDIDAKNKVSYYDDSRDGSVRTLEVKDAHYVIEFSNGGMKLGNREDIAANDVIHFFKETVIVRPFEDNKVEGTFERVSENRTTDEKDLVIKVEGENYDALLENAKRDPVYSKGLKEVEFGTVTSSEYDVQLKPFKDEEVTLLRDVNGYVQLITSDRVDSSFLAVVQNRLNNEFRLYREDNESVYYDTNLRETDFIVEEADGEIKDAQAGEFVKFDLVRATAKDELLTELVKLTTVGEAYEVELMNRNVIETAYGEYRLAKRAVVFTIDGSKVRAYTVEEFLKAFGDRNKEITIADNIDADFYINSKTSLVEAVIIGDLGLVKEETITAKITDKFTEGGKYYLELDDVEYALGTGATAKAAYNAYVKGDILEVDVTSDKEIILSTIVEKLMEGPVKVVSKTSENLYTLKDSAGTPKLLWLSRTATIYGGIDVDDIVTVSHDGSTIDVVDRKASGTRLGLWGSDAEPETPEDLVLTDVYYVGDQLTIRVNGNNYDYVGTQTAEALDRMTGAEVELTFVTGTTDQVRRVSYK